MKTNFGMKSLLTGFLSIALFGCTSPSTSSVQPGYSQISPLNGVSQFGTQYPNPALGINNYQTAAIGTYQNNLQPAQLNLLAGCFSRWSQTAGVNNYAVSQQYPNYGTNALNPYGMNQNLGVLPIRPEFINSGTVNASVLPNVRLVTNFSPQQTSMFDSAGSSSLAPGTPEIVFVSDNVYPTLSVYGSSVQTLSLVRQNSWYCVQTPQTARVIVNACDINKVAVGNTNLGAVPVNGLQQFAIAALGAVTNVYMQPIGFGSGTTVTQSGGCQ